MVSLMKLASSNQAKDNNANEIVFNVISKMKKMTQWLDKVKMKRMQCHDDRGTMAKMKKRVLACTIQTI